MMCKRFSGRAWACCRRLGATIRGNWPGGRFASAVRLHNGWLVTAGRKPDAESFDAAVRQAQQRDCVVMVTWTGDADIDLVVEEPAGTLVSQRQPRSVSGGVHLGDVSSADGKSTAKGFSEAYV